MFKKFLPYIISILIIAVIITGVIISKNAKKIPANPPETLGNTSGNLNNQGLFCESDGFIYFANANDNYYLYKMDVNGSNIVRLMDVPVSFINAAGDYLYFYYNDQGEAKFMGVAGNMRGIYRLDKKGKSDLVCLERATSAIVNLIGNRIYYQHYDNTEGMTLYYCSTDGTDKEQAVKAIINPACVINGNIYYPDQDNYFYLNVYSPGSSYGRLYMEEEMYNPSCVGSYIYYMKIDDDYRLYRYDMNAGTSTKITNDRVDSFNVHGNNIFYQRNSHPALIKLNADGSNLTVIAEGNFKNINCTSTYTFFQDFNDETMYMTDTNGFGGYSVFTPTVDTK